MAASPRSLKITYGSYTIGGESQTAWLDGGYTITGTYAADVVSFAAIIFGASDSAFASAVAAIEAAFATPRARLKIEQGSSTLLDLDPTTGSGGNTGFNAEPSFTKSEHLADTGRSRRYVITITVQRPADLSGQNGRRDAGYTLSYDPSRRATLLFAGEYTAVGANTAKQMYDSNAATYFAGIISGLGGTFEKVSEDLVIDDTTKVLRYATVYREIIYSQAGGSLDSVAIVDHRVMFTRLLEAPGDFGKDVTRMTDVLVLYDCSVDKTSTVDLEALWRGTLRDYLIGQAKALYGASAVALEADNPSMDRAANRITASLRLKMLIGTSNVLRAKVVQRIRDESGLRFTPVWDGKPFSAHVDAGAAIRIRSTEQTVLVKGGASPHKFLGSGGGESFGIVGASGSGQIGGGSYQNGGDYLNIGLMPSGGAASGGGSGWKLVYGDSSAENYTLGIKGHQIEVAESVNVKVERYVEAPSTGGGGGGLSPGPGGSFAGASFRGI